MKQHRSIPIALAGLALGVLATSAFATTKYEQTLLTQNAVVYWNFDEANGATTAPANGIALTDQANDYLTYNPSKHDFPGMVNGAVKFNTGSPDTIQIYCTQDLPDLGGGANNFKPTAWSMSFWYKPETYGDFTLSAYGVNSPYVHFQSGGAWLGVGDGGGPNHQATAESFFSLPLSQWSHIVETYQETGGAVTEKLYVNGALVDTLDENDFWLVPGVSTGFDPGYTDWNRFVIDGTVPSAIDELAVFGYVLSQSQILDQMNSVPEPGLLSLLAIGGVLMVWRRKVVAKRA